MKTTTLAWLMLVLGALGWLLLCLALGFWLSIDFEIQEGRSQLLGFFSLLFAGSFCAGLCHAWFLIFATWTGRLLPASARSGSGLGTVAGAIGVAAVLGLVASVLLAGADGFSGQSTAYSQGLTLAVLAVVLVFEGRWNVGFATRSSLADAASL